VLEAVDADQAESILRSRADVWLAFCDIKLPGGRSGFDLLDVVRRDFPHVKVLFSSGVIKDEEAIREGVSFLRKPYILFEVQRRIEALLAALRTQLAKLHQIIEASSGNHLLLQRHG
jgi:CheY-like chemotaxis protein